ncbi:MAG TPA: hypothetical protein ENF93_01400 [Ignisphaera sp.]|nr:hypothetical protein [Ignisphaera sp.]
MRVKVFLCIEREVETLVPRHHLAPLAICREVKEVELRDLEGKIPSAIIEKLIQYNSAIIKDPMAIKELTGYDKGAAYVKLIKV